MNNTLIFIKRHGFLSEDGRKFVGYLYKDKKTNRIFSVAHQIGHDQMYVNEIDEGFDPKDNIYSTVVARSIPEAKRLIEEILSLKNKDVFNVA